MTSDLRQTEPAAPQASRKRILERTRDLIEEAAAAGFFSNLPGSGQPLDFSFESNPFLPEGSRSAFRLLKNAGYALPWMEERKEIDRRQNDLSRQVESHLERVESTSRNLKRIPSYLLPSRRSRLRDEHADFLARFRRSVEILNRKIDIYNLSVPSVNLQIPRFDAIRALARLSEALPESGDGSM